MAFTVTANTSTGFSVTAAGYTPPVPQVSLGAYKHPTSTMPVAMGRPVRA